MSRQFLGQTRLARALVYCILFSCVSAHVTTDIDIDIDIYTFSAVSNGLSPLHNCMLIVLPISC